MIRKATFLILMAVILTENNEHFDYIHSVFLKLEVFVSLKIHSAEE